MQALKRRRVAWVLSRGLAFFCLALVLGQGLQADTGSRANFDHAITGFPLSGAHQRTSCESCHVNGIFKGTPTQCVFCHQSGSKTSSTSKPPSHIPTNAACDECHSTTSTWAGAHFNHFSSGGVACANCHNGSFTTGKPSNHVPSAPTCESCHRGTATWGGARYDHAGVGGGCNGCHSGTFLGVSFRPSNHVPSAPTCDSCHRTTSTWIGAKYDHAGIASGCTNCHNGAYLGVAGAPPSHIPGRTTNCEGCHSPSRPFP